MQHGTVCVILEDGTTTCPNYLLPKKQLIQNEVNKMAPIDQSQLITMHDGGVNLNHAINVSKLIHYYNAKQAAEKAGSEEAVQYTLDLASRGIERFSDIANQFVNTMDRLTGLQYQILGTTGEIKKAASQEFKSVYQEAIETLERLGDYHLTTPETDYFFHSKRKLINYAKREGVYVNDIDDVKHLRHIAQNAKWLNCAMLGLGVLNSATDVIVTYRDGGDWKKEATHDITDLAIDAAAGRALALIFAPEGWLVLIITSAIEVVLMDYTLNPLANYLEDIASKWFNN